MYMQGNMIKNGNLNNLSALFLLYHLEITSVCWSILFNSFVASIFDDNNSVKFIKYKSIASIVLYKPNLASYWSVYIVFTKPLGSWALALAGVVL